MSALRILIADDHAGVRRGIRRLLESHEGWQVSGEATDGRDAVEQAGRLRPDLVVLDITMPRLNGLEAARQIRQAMPATQVVVLTAHETDELLQEARRAGARGVVFKSDADQSLLSTIESSLRATEADVHLAGSIVGAVHHVGAFFHSAEERYQVLEPFIVEGLDQGQKAVHVIDPADRQSHLRRLKDAGVDVEGAEARGKLDLATWKEAHFSDQPFDDRALLAVIEGGLQKGSDDGFSITRLIGMGSRGSVHWDDLVSFESRLNAVLPRYDDIVVCAYEVAELPGDVVTDMMRVHPALVIGGSLYDNPFYAPPTKMAEEMKNRAQH